MPSRNPAAMTCSRFGLLAWLVTLAIGEPTTLAPTPKPTVSPTVTPDCVVGNGNGAEMRITNLDTTHSLRIRTCAKVLCIGEEYEDCVGMLAPDQSMSLRVGSGTRYYAAAYCIPLVACTGQAYEIYADLSGSEHTWPASVSVLPQGTTHSPTGSPTANVTNVTQGLTTTAEVKAAAATVSATVAAAAATATVGAIASAAGSASASGSANAGMGGPNPGQSLSDAAGLIESLQGQCAASSSSSVRCLVWTALVLLGIMSSTADLADVVSFADEVKWAAFLVRSPWSSDESGSRREGVTGNSVTGERAADEFEGALLIVAGMIVIVTMHAAASKRFRLPLAISFPAAEFYVVKLVFGALAVASALVLHPTFSIDWPYQAAAGMMLGCVLAPYVLFIWYILHKKCSLDGPHCSYKKEDEKGIEREGSKREVSKSSEASHTASPVGTAKTTTTDCSKVMRTKKGHWHGGQAEEEAAAAWREMSSAVLKVLEILSGFDSRTECSQIPDLVDSLKHLHQRYLEFNIGNAFTWCCPCCNPTPEHRIKSALCRIATELNIDIVPDGSFSTSESPTVMAKRASLGRLQSRLESTLTNDEWVDLVRVKVKLRVATGCCDVVIAKRVKAQAFIAEFGSNFRRFDSENRYMEVALLTVVLLFSLCVGLLQEYSKTQSAIGFSLYFVLACYMCTNPFNEYLRFPFELASVACFTTALLLVLLYNLDVLDDAESVGSAVNYLSISSVGCKILYAVVSALPFYFKMCTAKCCPEKKEHEDGSSLQVEVNPQEVEVKDCEVPSPAEHTVHYADDSCVVELTNGSTCEDTESTDQEELDELSRPRSQI